MGQAGFVVGADALIGLLRNGKEIPKAELVWALESISGLAFGDDAATWADWWDGVPEEAKCLSRGTDGPGVVAEPNSVPTSKVAKSE
jgi:hypothetical protein